MTRTWQKFSATSWRLPWPRTCLAPGAAGAFASQVAAGAAGAGAASPSTWTRCLVRTPLMTGLFSAPAPAAARALGRRRPSAAPSAMNMRVRSPRTTNMGARAPRRRRGPQRSLSQRRSCARRGTTPLPRANSPRPSGITQTLSSASTPTTSSSRTCSSPTAPPPTSATASFPRPSRTRESACAPRPTGARATSASALRSRRTATSRRRSRP
mmetsp:Transcript_26422/g.77643  ORF Transcript_26422/g.77643 Transcript_26422/m.77643 type:complete len:212 (+) Transcript_26422:283-918(+)